MEGRKWRILEGELGDAVKRAVLAAARRREICGLLIDNGYFLELIFMRNKSRIPNKCAFYFGEVRAIERACRKVGHRIIGTFHSIPGSSADIGGQRVENGIEGSLVLVVSSTEKRQLSGRQKRGR